MKYPKTSFAVFALGATALALPATAQARPGASSGDRAQAEHQASGAPQRDSSRTPPGLAELMLDPNRGILRAIVATQGSNSRLQDRPDSP